MLFKGAVVTFLIAVWLLQLDGVNCADLSKHPVGVISASTGMANHQASVPVTLLTFDVDGTLVKGIGSSSMERTAHSKAFMVGVGKVFTEDETFGQRYDTPLEFIPSDRYHGATDGLIALNIVKHAFGDGFNPATNKNIDALKLSDASNHLPAVFEAMYEYIATLSDEALTGGIRTLPGVTRTLKLLAEDPSLQQHTLCGLVTGNVEGIARKKMRSCGIFQTGALARKASDQQWRGEDAHAFLGGFGSDFCSGDITDVTRLYKDRGEQIAIAYLRAQQLLQPGQVIVRVVHVGDAPSDVLATKWCYEQQKFGADVAVGCVGVATGSYSADALRQLVGETVQGQWEPVILARGIDDPGFIDACGIVTHSDCSK